jgi:hypothetical protein
MTVVSAKIEGLEDAMKAIAAAFPSDPKKQKSLLNSSMRQASTATILKQAKILAMQGDGSGALSEALGIRAQGARKLRAKSLAAGIEIAPIRSNRKAMAMYINHYYTSRGRNAPAKMVASGIRHGHLVEFGSVNNAPARPFLYPAATSQTNAYVSRFANDLKRKTEKAVKRAAKKR